MMAEKDPNWRILNIYSRDVSFLGMLAGYFRVVSTY